MKTLASRKAEPPIEGMSQDDFEFAVDHMVCVEFGEREWYAQGKELAERGMTVDDLIENDGGRLNEIMARFELPYSTLRAILWNSIIAKHDKITIKHK